MVSSFPLNKSHVPIPPLDQSQRCCGMSPWPLGYTVRGGSQPWFVAWFTFSWTWHTTNLFPVNVTRWHGKCAIIYLYKWYIPVPLKLFLFTGLYSASVKRFSLTLNILCRTKMAWFLGWMRFTCYVGIGSCQKLSQVWTLIYVFICLSIEGFDVCVSVEELQRNTIVSLSVAFKLKFPC